MDSKAILGIVLTIAGLALLVYGAIDMTSGSVARASIIYAVLGGIFFFAGIGLMKTSRS